MLAGIACGGYSEQVRLAPPPDFDSVLINGGYRYDIELEKESKTELKVFERFNSNPGPLLVSFKKRAESSRV